MTVEAFGLTAVEYVHSLTFRLIQQTEIESRSVRNQEGFVFLNCQSPEEREIMLHLGITIGINLDDTGAGDGGASRIAPVNRIKGATNHVRICGAKAGAGCVDQS